MWPLLVVVLYYVVGWLVTLQVLYESMSSDRKDPEPQQQPGPATSSSLVNIRVRSPGHAGCWSCRAVGPSDTVARGTRRARISSRLFLLQTVGCARQRALQNWRGGAGGA